MVEEAALQLQVQESKRTVMKSLQHKLLSVLSSACSGMCAALKLPLAVPVYSRVILPKKQ